MRHTPQAVPTAARAAREAAHTTSPSSFPRVDARALEGAAERPSTAAVQAFASATSRARPTASSDGHIRTWAATNEFVALEPVDGPVSGPICRFVMSNHLEVSVIGTTDKVTIDNWYGGAAYRVEGFVTSDGRVLNDSRVDSLVQAMAAFAPPASGQTSLTTEQQTALAPVLAASWV